MLARPVVHNSPDDVMAAKNSVPLRDDIRLLGRILGDTVREQEGASAFELVEHIRQMQPEGAMLLR
jgi:phosphoenolpyruvate carboxylase